MPVAGVTRGSFQGPLRDYMSGVHVSRSVSQTKGYFILIIIKKAATVRLELDNLTTIQSIYVAIPYFLAIVM